MIPTSSSLRRKVSLTLFAAIGIALVLSAIGLIGWEYRTAGLRAEAALETLADSVWVNAETAVQFGLPNDANHSLASLGKAEQIVAARIFRTVGQTSQPELFAEFMRPGSQSIVDGTAGASGFASRDGRARLSQRRTLPDGTVAILQLETELSYFRRGLGESAAVLAVILFVLLLCGAFLSNLLQRSITGPVLVLAETAAKVHQTGDFTLRTPIRTRDELGRLGEQFNEMLSGIAERDRRIVESHAFQQTMLASAGLAVVSTDPVGTIRTFNHAAEVMLGYRADDVIGVRSTAILHEPGEVSRRAQELCFELGEAVQPGFEVFVARARRGKPETREWTYLRKDGSRFPVLLTISALRGADDSLLGFVGLALDLTERKAAEAALRASEEQFKLLTEHAPDAIVVIDAATGRFTSVNAAAERLFEQGREDLLARPYAQLSAPQQPDGRPAVETLQRYVAAAVNGGAPTFEWTHRTPAGRELVCEVRLLRLPDPARTLVRGSIVDLSERKRTELALRALNQSTAGATGSGYFSAAISQVAQELRVRFALIGEFCEPAGRPSVRSLALWIDGPAPNVTYELAGTPCANVTAHPVCHFPTGLVAQFPADQMLRDLGAVSYMGVQIRDNAGRKLGLVAVFDDKPMPDSESTRLLLSITAARAGTEIQRLRADEAITRLNAELEQRVQQRTAELQLRVAEVEHLNQALRSVQAVTDRTAANLQEANANLLAANQELEAFSYSVSHDLRAPLRNITGFIELLRKRTAGKLEAESERFTGIISAEAQRMGALIDDLLTFSRIGRTELKPTRVQLAELVAEARQEIAQETANRIIEWRVLPLPEVMGDRTLLRQVVVNLVANAAKFTRKREVAVIEIGHQPGANPQDDGVFYVRDNGAGFNPKYIEKLFRVFQRLHSARDFEGTGIGLANVKRIVLRHGGRVWAEGALDAGATFFFTLHRSPPHTP